MQMRCKSTLFNFSFRSTTANLEESNRFENFMQMICKWALLQFQSFFFYLILKKFEKENLGRVNEKTFGDRAAAGNASKHFSATIRQQMAWTKKNFCFSNEKCASLGAKISTKFQYAKLHPNSILKKINLSELKLKKRIKFIKNYYNS